MGQWILWGTGIGPVVSRREITGFSTRSQQRLRGYYPGADMGQLT